MLFQKQIFFLEEKKTLNQNMSASSIEFFAEFAPLTKKIRVWSVASCTGKVFLNENRTVRLA
jgi:hypothetical protein